MYAHSRDRHRPVDWHGLKSHSEGTAALARGFAAVFGAAELADALGLVHDAGKAYCVWQQRLLAVAGLRERIGIPHADVGARLIGAVAGEAALAVLGHHKG